MRWTVQSMSCRLITFLPRRGWAKMSGRKSAGDMLYTDDNNCRESRTRAESSGSSRTDSHSSAAQTGAPPPRTTIQVDSGDPTRSFRQHSFRACRYSASGRSAAAIATTRTSCSPPATWIKRINNSGGQPTVLMRCSVATDAESTRQNSANLLTSSASPGSASVKEAMFTSVSRAER